MHAEVARGHIGAKLAFTRLTFNYFISETVFAYILDAVHLHRRAWLEAAAALPVRSRQRPLAPSRRRRRPPTSLSTALQGGPRRLCDRSRERAARSARGGAAGHPLRPGAPARRSAARPRAKRRVRADPLVSAARRGARAVARDTRACRRSRPRERTRRRANRAVIRRVLQPQRSRGIKWNVASPVTGTRVACRCGQRERGARRRRPDDGDRRGRLHDVSVILTDRHEHAARCRWGSRSWPARRASSRSVCWSSQSRPIG